MSMTPPHVASSNVRDRVIRLALPHYEIGHPLVVVEQRWPCWLTSVVSLALPLEKVFVQDRYKNLFDEPTSIKLMSCWSSLDHIHGFSNYSAVNILGSGSLKFLDELPTPFLHESNSFVYAVELDFRRFHRKRDLDRMLRSIATRLAGKHLDSEIVHHADFGGVTNASYVVAARGIDTACFRTNDGLPRTLSHIISAATPGNHKAIEPPPPIHILDRRPMVVDGLLRREGLFDVYSPKLNVACPSVFKKSKWVQRRLSQFETLRMWDVQLSLDSRMDTQDIERLALSMSPLLISSFLRNIWGRGEAPPLAARTDGQASIVDDIRCQEDNPPPTIHHTILECKGRQTLGDLPSVDLVYPVAMIQEDVSLDNGCMSEAERLDLVKGLHDEAKAVKSDDAEVPTYLWDNFITRGGKVTTELARQLTLIRQVALQWYRRKLTRDCCLFLNGRHGDWTHDRHERQGDHKLNLDMAAMREIVHRACYNTWFEYSAGSRLHFFRFPSKYMTMARDGVPVSFMTAGPSEIRPQLNMAAAERAVLKKKILAMWQKRYLDVPAGKLKSAISYFAVPKGEVDGVVQDWRVVFHAGANGLNDCVWAPSFWLPSVESLLRIVDESSFMEDRDVGEMFLNYELHPMVRKFAGVDLRPLEFTEEECPHRWLYWTKNLMGFRSSPYNSVKMYLIAEEMIRGERLDSENPFRWHHAELNLPGTTSYNPARAWVTKRRVDGSLASDIVVFVDDKRLVGSGQQEVKDAGHRCSTREAYLGIQDALRKWRSAGGTRTPGAWAGVVVHIDPSKGVLVLTSQEKWDKMKSICNHWLDLLKRGETALDHKRLQSDCGFMVYVTQAYPMLKPYLKGFHLSLETWRGGRDEEGWKIRLQPRTEEEDDGPDRDEVEAELDEGDIMMEAAGTTTGPASGITMAVPRFCSDLEAILFLAESVTPRMRVVRSTSTLTAFYGFGDASSDGFGATIERKSGVVGRYGLWAADTSEQSSNFRELLNLVETIEEEGAAGSLANTEIWLFTDNSTAEGCFHRGSSSSQLLHELVLRLRKAELDHGLVLYLVHVAGKRMIAQGTDGLSRGLLLEGVLSGRDMLSYVDLARTALDRQPALLEYVQSWTDSYIHVLSPEDWFVKGHGMKGGGPNKDEDAGNFGFRHVSSFSSRFVTFRPFFERTFKSTRPRCPDICTAVRAK